MMDPFGYGTYHDPRTYYGGGYNHHHHHRSPPHPFYHGNSRRAGEVLTTTMNRRFRRRLRLALLLLALISCISALIYWQITRRLSLERRGRASEVLFASLVDEVVGKKDKSPSISKPDTISPPVEAGAPLSPIFLEKDGPPSSNHMGIPLDKSSIKNSTSSVDEHGQHHQQILDLEQLLEAENSPLRKLSSQVEDLTQKLISQSELVDSLQKKLHERHADSSIAKGGMTSLGQEVLEGLGITHQKEKTGSTKKTSRKGDKDSFYYPLTLNHPPISTVMCTGTNTTDRVCKFKNLCFDSQRDAFFIFKDTNSLEVNVPTNRSYLTDTTSIDGHNKFFFDYNEVHPHHFKGRRVLMVDKLTFMVSRFHALNIMHTMHDDFFGLYALHRMFAPSDDTDDRFSFTRNNLLFFLDGYEAIRYDYMFQFISDNPLLFRNRVRRELASKGEQAPLCFRDVVVGNSKIGSWYSYGFLEPQGPIPQKNVSGLFVRDVATFLMNRMDIPIWDERVIRSALQDLYLHKLSTDQLGGALARVPRSEMQKDAVFIALFTRQLDRLIVNEAELIKALEQAYGIPVKTIRMEDMHLGQQVAILRSSVIAIGMHGSALILSMFLPPGAILVELFPYAVPADNYTPYKTLCRLPGMRLTYRSWTNKKMENNFPHPEKPPSGGGIAHLSLAEQERIKNLLTVPPHLCCSDPVWLYRIYQDTRVDIPSLLSTINGALKEALAALDTDPQSLITIRPAVIDNVQCFVQVPPNTPQPFNNSTKLDLEVRWDPPWNGIIPDRYGIWVHQPYKEFITEQNKLRIPSCTYGSKFDIWVRSYINQFGSGSSSDAIRSPYSEKVTCYCRPDTVARKTDPGDL